VGADLDNAFKRMEKAFGIEKKTTVHIPFGSKDTVLDDPINQNRIATLTSYANVGKLLSGQFERELKNYCFMNDVKLKLELDKGFFMNTFRFKLTGTVDKLNEIKHWMEYLDE
jgi:hypothetical protein